VFSTGIGSPLYPHFVAQAFRAREPISCGFRLQVEANARAVLPAKAGSHTR
jgi:hypothetical protein